MVIIALADSNAKKSVGQIGRGSNRPGDKTPCGGTKSPWDKKSMGQKIRGTKSHWKKVHEEKIPGKDPCEKFCKVIK